MKELLRFDRILRKGVGESLLNVADEARLQVDEFGPESLVEAQPVPFHDGLVGVAQKT